MENILDFLWLPFLISIVLVGIHTYLGRYILARNIVFADLALAQIAALGATLGFILGHGVGSLESYGWSLLFTFSAAVLLAFTKSWTHRLPQEALIGIIYVVAASLMFLLVEKAPQGTEHIKQLLTGNILTVSNQNYWIIPLYGAISAIIWLIRHQLQSSNSGLKGWFSDFVFYACFGIVVTSSVAIAGVLLVFSLLIIPISIGKIYFDDAKELLLGWIVGTLACFVGLILSYIYDLTPSSAIVCSLAAFLIGASIFKLFLSDVKAGFGKFSLGIRLLLASILILSAFWLVLYPKKDQPLLDSVEFMYPNLRFLYLNQIEKKIQIDVQQHAIKYKKRIEELNSQENESRWKGSQLTEEQIQKVSSFLRIYNEMIRGENYVLREVIGRARERSRYTIAIIYLLLGAIFIPISFWKNLIKFDLKKSKFFKKTH